MHLLYRIESVVRFEEVPEGPPANISQPIAEVLRDDDAHREPGDALVGGILVHLGYASGPSVSGLSSPLSLLSDVGSGGIKWFSRTIIQSASPSSQ